MESSHRDLFNDKAAHRPIFKNNKKNVPSPFWFRTQNSYRIPQNGVLFLLWFFFRFFLNRLIELFHNAP